MHFSRPGLFIAGFIALTCTLAQADAPKSLTVAMAAQNGSKQDGTATLTQDGSDVKIVVALKNEPASASEPTHIHAGTCSKLNPAPEKPLSSTESGSTTSVLKDTQLASLTGGKYSINVHKSASDLATYVSCGTIK
ncbi:MAG: hypothetical protein JOZ38_02995 [Candidatus Eremiobacteraeota bacterium]|nr:hypothetical protein [Candidatus Eremiobacteraeota bacterium]